jgi:hypothetical protein
MLFVGLDMARQTACYRPECAAVERFEQYRVGHEAGDPAIAVDEGMDPQQAMMRASRRQDSVGASQAA